MELARKDTFAFRVVVASRVFSARESKHLDSYQQAFEEMDYKTLNEEGLDTEAKSTPDAGIQKTRHPTEHQAFLVIHVEILM